MVETKLAFIRVIEEHKKGVHAREISRLLKTGMPNILRYAKILQKEGVIVKEKDANLIKYKLKNNPLTLAYLAQVHANKFLALPKKVQLGIKDFLSELTVKPLIVLIFGSYAKGNYTDHSDIDVMLIFQELKEHEQIERTAKRINMRTNIKISPVYVTYNDFEKNFLNKEHQFSNEIRNNIILLEGINLYYSLLWRFLE